MTNSQILGKARPFFKSTMTNTEYQERLFDIRRYLSRIPKTKKQAHPINVIKTTDYFDSWDAMISNVLRTLDCKGSDYLFNEDQILEVLKYRPRTKVTYIGENYWIVSFK